MFSKTLKKRKENTAGKSIGHVCKIYFKTLKKKKKHRWKIYRAFL
jgi:hypothetical protein